MLETKELVKIYKPKKGVPVTALNKISLKFPEKGMVFLLGKSGSGKSTLLNMLAGLEHPSKGEIVIAGKHIEKLNEKQLVTFRRERVGFIFQSYNLIATMDAVENVALPLSFRGMGKAKRAKRAKEYLKLVGLERFMTHMPNQMSGGQQQRVGIARALAVDPQIIFADEPTGNLDSKTTMEVLKLMQTIVRERNQTLVMVTHDNNLATYADRIIKIIDGKIVSIEENHKEADLEAAREEADQKNKDCKETVREETPQKKMTEEKESGENL